MLLTAASLVRKLEMFISKNYHHSLKAERLFDLTYENDSLKKLTYFKNNVTTHLAEIFHLGI